MTTPPNSVSYTMPTRVDLSNANFTWCTCGNAAGGARMPNPNCEMHTGPTRTYVWTLRA